MTVTGEARETREQCHHVVGMDKACDWGSGTGEVAGTGILLEEWTSMLVTGFTCLLLPGNHPGARADLPVLVNSPQITPARND